MTTGSQCSGNCRRPLWSAPFSSLSCEASSARTALSEASTRACEAQEGGARAPTVEKRSDERYRKMTVWC